MRMRNYTFAVIMSLSFILATLSGCAQTEAQQNTDYEGTKKMVIDLLKTDEGKKALHELIAQEDMREEIVMDSAFVKQTIQDTLTSDEGKKYWQEVMKDLSLRKLLQKACKRRMKKSLNH